MITACQIQMTLGSACAAIRPSNQGMPHGQVLILPKESRWELKFAPLLSLLMFCNTMLICLNPLCPGPTHGTHEGVALMSWLNILLTAKIQPSSLWFQTKWNSPLHPHARRLPFQHFLTLQRHLVDALNVPSMDTLRTSASLIPGLLLMLVLRWLLLT